MQWSLSMRTFNASSAAWSIFSFQTHYSHPNFMIFFFYSLFLRIAQYPTRLCCFNGLIILGLDYWALTFRGQFWSFFHRLIDCSLIQASLGCLAIADPTLAQEAAKILRLAHRLAKCKWSLFILDFLPHYFKHGESLAVESGIGPSGKSTFQSFFYQVWSSTCGVSSTAIGTVARAALGRCSTPWSWPSVSSAVFGRTRPTSANRYLGLGRWIDAEHWIYHSNTVPFGFYRERSAVL